MASCRRGFTLMEMITVMAIATLITIASAPAFMNFTRTQRIRGAASEIASALNSARRYAITHNKPYPVHIYSNDYADTGLRNSFLFWETELTTERKLLHRAVDIFDVSGDHVPGNPWVYEFNFTARGMVEQGGTIRVRDTGSNREIEVSVLASTGRVRVGELNEIP